MLDRDLVLRNLTYRLFVKLGRAPSLGETASALDTDIDETWAGWQRLADDHALVLQVDTPAVRMASPFSAVPTSYSVIADGRSWYANCAWDAFGICAALHVDGRIATSCACCGDRITVNVDRERPDDQTLLFHSLVPASHWWDDIVFT